MARLQTDMGAAWPGDLVADEGKKPLAAVKSKRFLIPFCGRSENALDIMIRRKVQGLREMWAGDWWKADQRSRKYRHGRKLFDLAADDIGGAANRVSDPVEHDIEGHKQYLE